MEDVLMDNGPWNLPQCRVSPSAPEDNGQAEAAAGG